MAYSQVLDLTNEINNSPGNIVVIDTGAYIAITAQVVANTTTISVSTSNDGGGIEGVTNGSSISATSFQTCNGIDLSSSDPTTNLTDQIANNKLVKFINYGKYLQFAASGVLDKFIINCYQIN